MLNEKDSFGNGDKTPGLAVLQALRPPPGVEDGVDGVLGQGLPQMHLD